MGVFDEIICLYPLPIGDVSQVDFQTEDMKGSMSKFEISVEGHFSRMVPITELIPGEKDVLGRPARRIIDYTRVPQPFSGAFNVYGELVSADGVEPVWIEVAFLFHEGMLVSLVQVSPEVPKPVVFCQAPVMASNLMQWALGGKSATEVVALEPDLAPVPPALADRCNLSVLSQSDQDTIKVFSNFIDKVGPAPVVK